MNYQSQFDVDQQEDMYLEDSAMATGREEGKLHVLSSRVGANEKITKKQTSSKLQGSIVERGDSSSGSRSSINVRKTDVNN